MVKDVDLRCAMKTSVIPSLSVLILFAICAHGGEVERFINETLEERRTQKVSDVVNDAIDASKIPEFEFPKENIFTSKDKERDARYYRYDKSGRLVSVEYAAMPEKNEYYAYDKQGNIIEKRIGGNVYKYTYDTGNQLMEMESPYGKREYYYDHAGRLITEKLNGEIDAEYKYGYLDKVIEVNRRGKITKFAYDGLGMLAQKTFDDGSTEIWVWDGLALIRRGSDIYVNEPHVSGGVPIISKTAEGVRYHEHDFLGTTLWSTDTKGNIVKDYQDTTIFGEGSIQKDRSARFTGKPYDEDLQAYVFPYRNYDASTARWRSSDPAGYPDGINQHFYAAVPTYSIDVYGLDIYHYNDSTGAFGFGHSAWIVGNKNDGYNVFDYGNAEGSSGSTMGGTNINGTHYNDFALAEAALQANRRSNTTKHDNGGNITQNGHGYDRSQSIATTHEQAAGKYGNESYDPTDHNLLPAGHYRS